ncbi:unnamed protein product [Plutella xylostella]|uniref:UDP-N-acetylglucosamine 1-carboxyvinyltransferase n=1 Tax=Plutella xylostella TaxID=51655 RepID=A0A8S4EIZ7_PLUXY|nr:UDP-N-acetylglucosamine 1-carboxyvinyltransferase 2 [Plutella xylostella]CAG9115651.1 unnamed protein product [Plutella xylostella]
MEEIVVVGGNKLKGSVKIEGAKNSALPILAASLLADDGVTTLYNVPDLSDVIVMNQVMEGLNAKVSFDKVNNTVLVDATLPLSSHAPDQYVSKMRASICFMGVLLARTGKAKLSVPGGCAIGKRPIDQHLKAFKALGAEILYDDGYIEITGNELIGNIINLDFPSVGATQNIMMAAVKAKGTTFIHNAAQEPEIVDLAKFLNKMGAQIYKYGTECIQIIGVDNLKAVSYTIMEDRIEAGTFMIAAAMTKGNVLIENARFDNNLPLIYKLIKMGARIVNEKNGIRVTGPEVLKSTNITTMPYPGFPTDLQAPITAILSVSQGTGIVTETIFEDRFQHLEEMLKMEASVRWKGNAAIIEGVDKLQGAVVYATDLRAAAALVLAGLTANGTTRVRNLKYLDRGYYKFHQKLQNLGAKVARKKYLESKLYSGGQ